MNKLFTYILAVFALIFMSCSSNPEQDITEIEGVSATLSELNDITENITRATLSYSYTAKLVQSSWETGDKVGVFPYGASVAIASRAQQMPFTSTGVGHLVEFIGPNGITCFPKTDNSEGKKYVACFPYFEGVELGHHNLIIDYTGQQQSSGVRMKYYPFSGNTEPVQEYMDSEIAAAQNLKKYDYHVSDIVLPESNGNARFKFQRLGAIIRFYMKAPAKKIFDCIQIANRTQPFITKAKINVASQSLEPIETSNVVSVELPSLDFTDNTNDYYYKKVGYIIGYIMVAPINMKENDVTIYLQGHGGDGTKSYYKAIPSVLPKLDANDFFQWTLVPDKEEPITFEEITVEEWQEGTTITNGEDGKGTQTW